MSGGHLVGFFAIARDKTSESDAAFERAGVALDDLEEGFNELVDEAYCTARSNSVCYRELHKTADTNALSPFASYLSKTLQSYQDWGVYTPQTARRFSEELSTHEKEVGGEEALVLRIWNEDRNVSTEGIRNFYRTHQVVLSIAVKDNNAFAKGLYG